MPRRKLRTARPRARAPRDDSERKYAALFATAPTAVCVARRHDGVHLEVNDTWVRLTGHAADAAIGKTAQQLGLWADASERARVLSALAQAGSLTNHPTRFLRADGRAIAVLLSAVALEIDGEPLVLWSWNDVTDLRNAEQQMRTSQERFSAAFTNSPDAIAIVRLKDGRVLAVNDAWVQVNGYAREQVIGRTGEEIGVMETAERVALQAQLQAEGRVLNRPTSLLRADGTMRQALLSVVKIEFEGAPCVMFLGRDVTEAHHAEQAMRNSERRFRELFDQAMDGILVLSPEGDLVDINPVACRDVGYSCEELVGRPVALLVSEKDRPLVRAAVREALTHGPARFEFDIQSRDGRGYTVEVRAGRLADGNLLAFVRDVSERKRGERLLNNVARGVSAELGASFFRSLVSHLTRELGADYAFVGEITGRRRERVRTLAFFADGAERPNFEYALEGSPCINAIERRGTVAYGEGVADRFPADAGLRRMNVAGYVGTSLFDSKGEALGIMVIMSRKPIARVEFWSSILEIFAARAAAEIERASAEARVRELNLALERRVGERTAELAAANRDLESFSYSVSHDLRSPLGIINGFVAMLRAQEGGRMSEDGRSMLEHIERSATRSTALLEGLLEFSRLGRNPVSRRATSMHEAVEEVLGEMRARPELQRARIEVEALPDCMGDPVLLRQVWQNLIGNALKYSRGREAATIRIGYEAQPAMYYVRDNGAGFDMRYADKLFGVFERLHTEAEFEGTGVGLAIVRRIIERHGGRVSAEGEPERGATFRFSVPA